MSTTPSPKADFDRMTRERSETVTTIIESEDRKKLVVAGPGTGKTYLFREVVKSVGGSCLAITFINNLADDLRTSLGDLADSRTFHSFCKNFLHRNRSKEITQSFSYFPKLSRIVEKDAAILGMGFTSTDEAFQCLIEEDGRIDFYLQRGNYYDVVSHNDVVYRVIRLLRSNPKLTPAYNTVLVDEFQDFNALEVSLIDILSEASPVLIVGDDDQALYVRKFASPDFLRSKSNSGDYAQFPLPYCSRCTEPVVAAANQVIENAAKTGYLQNRLPKPFRCFLPVKHAEGAENPHLINVSCTVDRKSAPYMSKYIVAAINELVESGYMPEDSKDTYDFLIAGRVDLLGSAFDCVSELDCLTVEYRHKVELDVTKLDGIAELLVRDDSPIGWRALLEFESRAILEKTVKKSLEGTPVAGLVPDSTKEHYNHLLSLIRRLGDGEQLSITEETQLENEFDIPLSSVKDSLFPASSERGEQPDKYRAIVTTFMGCKGLSANYVFLIGLNNGFLPSNAYSPSDHEICQFVVGLTRTRKRCHLIHARNMRGQFYSPSLFLSWIDDGLLESVDVSKSYFN